MPGVIRPYTWADIIGALNGQSGTGLVQGQQQVTGLGQFAEADEPSMLLADAATPSAQTPPGWDAATWGTCVWG